jgi:hypothetical protein
MQKVEGGVQKGEPQISPRGADFLARIANSQKKAGASWPEYVFAFIRGDLTTRRERCNVAQKQILKSGKRKNGWFWGSKSDVTVV